MMMIGNMAGRRYGHAVRTGLVLAVGVALSGFFTAGHAQETPADGWHFEFTPYMWLSGLEGSLTLKDRPAGGLGVEQSFGDILKNLNFAAFGGFEARKGRWGAMVDGMYITLGNEGTVTGPLGFVSITATGDLTQQIYSLAGSYRVQEGESPADVVGGVRYTSIKSDLAITSSDPDVGVAGKAISTTMSWADPFIGIRYQDEIVPRFSLVGYADVGGFGVGSNLAIQGLVGANYAFSQHWVGKLGYRYMSVDYRETDLTYDMATSGMYLGVGIRF